MIEINLNYLNEAVEQWKVICPNVELPVVKSIQSNWDIPIIQSKLNHLLNLSNTSNTSRARMLAVIQKESGAWLKALPSPHLGTLLDKESLRIAVGIRLGIKICHPYTCRCGFPVDAYGIHGLSCNKSGGRYGRHVLMNGLIKRGLTTARCPARLEPPGLIREDGKRADGVTLVPWSHGKCLVWDATCVDTLANSYLKSTSIKAGAAANGAKLKKERLYSEIMIDHEFLAFAVETLGPFGDDTKHFVDVLGKLLNDASGDSKAKSYFIQRISLAIQRGNVASIMGTINSDSNLNEIFYLN